MPLTIHVPVRYMLVCLSWAVLVMCGHLRGAGAKLEIKVGASKDYQHSFHHFKPKLLPLTSDDRDYLPHVPDTPHFKPKLLLLTGSDDRDYLPHVPDTPRRDTGSRPLTSTLRTLLAPNRIPLQNATMKWSELTSADVTGAGEPSRHSPLKRVYKRTPVMNRFEETYSDFHQSLQVFVQLLSERFKPETPASLRNIRLIPEVMAPDDVDIVSRKVDAIIGKFFLLQEVLLTVFQKIKPFVKEKHIEWLRKQSMILKWRMNMVAFVTFSMRVGDPIPEMSILSAGISGANIGIQKDTNSQALLKLKELMEQLRFKKP